MNYAKDITISVEQAIAADRSSSSRWLIKEGEDQIFIGWKWELIDYLTGRESTLYKKLKDRKVQRLYPILDIKSKEWREKGLMAPLMPEETEDYYFKDLMTSIFNVIELKGEEE